jgi:apolipoprotein N-acyltransferase
VPASIALSLQRRHVLPAVTGVALFAANLLFGGIALGAHDGPRIRVALIADNEMSDAGLADDGHVALATIDSYDREALRSASDNVRLVVFPEKLAIIEPPWKADAQAKLSMTAKAMNATLVAGFENRDGNTRTNIAWVFRPDGGAPQTYEKRRLAPALEEALTPGRGPLVVPGTVGVDIGSDMDFGGMIRSDSKAHPGIIAVPAHDFGADGFSHARMAIMRGVENGFAVARAARIGLLSLSDAHGDLKAVGTWPNGFTTFEANVQLGTNAGQTIYGEIGDVFAWACLATSAGLLLAAFISKKRIA